MNNLPETMLSNRGRLLRRGVRTINVFYKGLSKTIEQPGYYPDDLKDFDDAVLVGTDFEPSDEALRELKEMVDCIPQPQTVKRIRTKLRLSQRRAGALLGGGPNAFDKYERGKAEPSQAMGVLLYLLDRHPELLDEVCALAEKTLSSGVINQTHARR